MCYGCWCEEGKPAIINDGVREAARLGKIVYDYHLAGGHLHILLDDWNAEDSHIDGCLDFLAKERAEMDEAEYMAELRCGRAFSPLTYEERISALALMDGIIDDQGREL